MATEKTPKITVDTLVSTTELAAVIGVSVRRVQQLSQDGVIIAASDLRGKYPLADSVQRYITFIMKDKGKEPSVLETEKLQSDVAFRKARATKATLEAQELAGKMHRSEDVQAMTEELLYAVRNGLQALPGRLAVDTAAAQSAPEASDVIRREVNLLMGDIAGFRYDPEKYKERVRDRMNWETAAQIEDE